MNYARVLDMLPDVNARGVTGDDATRAADAVREASDYLRRMAGARIMHSEVETRVFDGDGCAGLWVGDIQSVTTLKFDDDGDGTYETTLAASDYWLWPYNRESGIGARRIDLNPEGDYPTLPTGKKRVQVVGEWGYSRILQPVVGAAAITGTVATTSGLTITASADSSALLGRGDSVFLESEELGPILSVAANGMTFVVEARGINGTTAATHTTQQLYVRRYPRDIERAVRADAGRYLNNASQGYASEGFRSMWPAIDSVLTSLVDPAGVI